VEFVNDGNSLSAVWADIAHELAFTDVEGDAPECMDCSVLAVHHVPEGTKEPGAAPGNIEGLLEVLNHYLRHLVPSHMSGHAART